MRADALGPVPGAADLTPAAAARRANLAEGPQSLKNGESLWPNGQPATRMERLADWYRSTLGPAAAGAVLLWAALPPVDFGPLAFVGPVPWVVLIRRPHLAGRHPFRTLWAVGFAFWLAALHWLRLPHWATSFGWVALSAYFAFYLPVFIGLGRVAAHRLRIPVVLAAPVIWTGLELARAHLLTGFTMASLGHTQYRWIALIQVSDLVGAYGVSFLVMFAAACVGRMIPVHLAPAPDSRHDAAEGGVAGAGAWGWRSIPWWPAAMLILGLGAAVVYGHVRMAIPASLPQARIALIQGSIDSQIKSDPTMRDRVHGHYRQLSLRAVREYRAAGPVDLVVWPETMFREPLVEYDASPWHPPGWSRNAALTELQKAAAESQRALARLVEELGTAVVVGVDTESFAEGQHRFYNSAVWVDSQGHIRGRYDKMHLVMFGEYVPFAHWFPALQGLTPLKVSLSPGSGPTVFRVGGLRLAPNICYESVLPHLIRKQVQMLAEAGAEPHVLLNLTNDGWFWGSSELDMHLVCGVFRAVETRKPLLIAANTGFSAWIDGAGRILHQGPRRATGTILAQVARDSRRSLYLRYGDWFAGACLATCGLLALVALGGRLQRPAVRWRT